MKAKPYLVVVLSAAFAAVSGCVSVERCGGERLSELSINGTDSKPIEHIVVSNFGYYLFDLFPLIAGNADPDGWFPFVLFSDQVKLSKMQTLLSAEVQKRHGTEVVELTSHYDADPCFSVSLDPKSLLGLIFCCREVQLSAVLVEPEDKGGAPVISAGDSVTVTKKPMPDEARPDEPADIQAEISAADRAEEDDELQEAKP